MNGHTAILDYRQVSDRVVDYVRTFVPPEIRGRGVARHLTLHALAHALRHDLKVIPSCWFVAKVLRENADFVDLELAD